MDDQRNLIWAEKYRPKTIDEAILPKEIKALFTGYINEGFVSHLLLSGPPGVGKTTAARAMLEQLNADYMFINSSLYGNVDVLRTDIQQFASSVSLAGGRKYVILDEADRLSHAAQQGLRAFIEEFSVNTSFIFTCNNKHAIIEPLHSRCAVIDFAIAKGEKAAIAKQVYDRVTAILTQENVTFDKNVITPLIIKYFPDCRRILNELQRLAVASNHNIDSGALTETADAFVNQLIKLIREKSFTGMRKLLAENADQDFIRLYRQLYDGAYEHFAPVYVPQLVILIGDSLDEMSRSIDPEITFAKFLTHLMVDAQWK